MGVGRCSCPLDRSLIGRGYFIFLRLNGRSWPCDGDSCAGFYVRSDVAHREGTSRNIAPSIYVLAAANVLDDLLLQHLNDVRGFEYFDVLICWTLFCSLQCVLDSCTHVELMPFKSDYINFNMVVCMYFEPTHTTLPLQCFVSRTRAKGLSY